MGLNDLMFYFTPFYLSAPYLNRWVDGARQARLASQQCPGGHRIAPAIGELAASPGGLTGLNSPISPPGLSSQIGQLVPGAPDWPRPEAYYFVVNI